MHRELHRDQWHCDTRSNATTRGADTYPDKGKQGHKHARERDLPLQRLRLAHVQEHDDAVVLQVLVTAAVAVAREHAHPAHSRHLMRDQPRFLHPHAHTKRDKLGGQRRPLVAAMRRTLVQQREARRGDSTLG